MYREPTFLRKVGLFKRHLTGSKLNVVAGLEHVYKSLLYEYLCVPSFLELFECRHPRLISESRSCVLAYGMSLSY